MVLWCERGIHTVYTVELEIGWQTVSDIGWRYRAECHPHSGGSGNGLDTT